MTEFQNMKKPTSGEALVNDALIIMNAYIQAYAQSIVEYGFQFTELCRIQPAEIKELNRNIIIDMETLFLRPTDLTIIDDCLHVEVCKLYALEFMYMNMKKDLLDGTVERMQNLAGELSNKNRASLKGL